MSPGPPPPNARRVVLGSLAVLTVLGTVATGLSPVLLVEFPLLLVAGSAVNRHILLAAAVVDPVPLFFVASLRRWLSLVVTYGVATLYAAAALRWAQERTPWLHRPVAWLERQLARWGPWLLVPMSSYTLVGLAGATRMPLRPFLVAVTVGNALYVGALIWLGDAVAVWTLMLVAWLELYLLESTLVCLLLALAGQAWSRRHGGPGSLGPPEAD